MTPIPVELLHTEGCGSWRAARETLLSAAASAGLSIELSETLVADQAMAERLRFVGSPTLRVRGRDVLPEADGRTDFSLG